MADHFADSALIGVAGSLSGIAKSLASIAASLKAIERMLRVSSMQNAAARTERREPAQTDAPEQQPLSDVQLRDMVDDILQSLDSSQNN